MRLSPNINATVQKYDRKFRHGNMFPWAWDADGEGYTHHTLEGGWPKM